MRRSAPRPARRSFTSEVRLPLHLFDLGPVFAHRLFSAARCLGESGGRLGQRQLDQRQRSQNNQPAIREHCQPRENAAKDAQGPPERDHLNSSSFLSIFRLKTAISGGSGPEITKALRRKLDASASRNKGESPRFDLQVRESATVMAALAQPHWPSRWRSSIFGSPMLGCPKIGCTDIGCPNIGYTISIAQSRLQFRQRRGRGARGVSHRTAITAEVK